MKKLLNLFWKLACVLLLSASSCDKSSTLPPPSTGTIPGKTDMTGIYDFVQSYQLRYIRSLQLPSGAIRDNENGNKITPYFAHFAVLALLTDPGEENVAAVKNYMLWYFGKLNSAVTEFRNDETPGSVYDYYLPGEKAQGTYDSVDSYAATFLEIAARFAEVSKDCRNWLSGHEDKLSKVAEAMLLTIDEGSNPLPTAVKKDYLSIAHYRYAVKYLMDNTEVNMGLKAAIALRDKGLLSSSRNLEEILEGNTAGIASLYNTANRNYDYALGESSDWNQFYPGAVAQLYPCMFGVTSLYELRSKQIYERFNTRCPEWHKGITYSGHPWTMVSLAAAVMGDKERVDEYVKHIYDLNLKNEQKSLWYDAEAGSLVLAIDRIRQI